MWFSTASKTFDEKIVKIKWLNKWELEPHFEVYGSDEKFTNFSGSIVWAELSTYEYEGKPRDVFVLHMVDNEWEKYKLSASFTQLSRSLLNNLCSMQNYNSIELSLYVKGTIWQDGKGYTNPRIAVKQNWQLVSWKYKMDEVPKAEAIKNSKWDIIANDYTAVDEFWKGKVKDIAVISQNTKTDTMVPDVDDDLPF